MAPPALTFAGPVLATVKSATAATGLTVVLTVLLAGVGSVVPAGGLAVAVLVSVPLAAVTVPLMVNVTLPPDGRVVTVLVTFCPATLTVPQAAPPVAVPQVAVMLPIPTGTLSLKVAPSAADGPLVVSNTL